MFPCFNPNCSGPGKREASAIFRSLWYDQFSVWSQVLLTSRLTMQHLRHRNRHITKADRHTFRMEPVTLPENPHLKPSSSPFWRIPLDWLFSLFSMSPRSWSPPSKGEGVFVFFSIGASCPPSCGGTYRREKKNTLSCTDRLLSYFWKVLYSNHFYAKKETHFWHVAKKVSFM